MSFLSPEGEPLQNPYEVLGLNLGASDDEVNKSFKKLMLKLHPDKRQRGLSPEETAEINKEFQDVRNARTFLLDTEYMAHKRAYDSKLAAIERRKEMNPLPVLNRSTSKGVMFQSHDKEKRPNPFFNRSAPDLRRPCDNKFSSTDHDMKPAWRPDDYPKERISKSFFNKSANLKRACSNEYTPAGQDTKPARTRRPDIDNPRERRHKSFFNRSAGHGRARDDECPPTDYSSSTEQEAPVRHNNRIPSGRREKHDHDNGNQIGPRKTVNLRPFRRQRAGLIGVGRGVSKKEITSNRTNVMNNASEQDPNQLDRPEPKAWSRKLNEDSKRPPANRKSTIWRKKSAKPGNK